MVVLISMSCIVFFFFKQKTAYEMRISDWSSDVCSSDLRALLLRDALQTNEHGGLELGPNARPILRGEQPVTLILPPKRERGGKRQQAANPVGDPLFDALRAFRRELSLEAGVPPIGKASCRARVCKYV